MAKFYIRNHLQRKLITVEGSHARSTTILYHWHKKNSQILNLIN